MSGSDAISAANAGLRFAISDTIVMIIAESTVLIIVNPMTVLRS
jgi:hypothetical protein